MNQTILVMPHRMHPDYTYLYTQAMSNHWRVERWPIRKPYPALQGNVIYYGDPLISAILKEETGYNLVEPAWDWLATVPYPYVDRLVRATTLQELPGRTKGWPGPWFIKPAQDKIFEATVFNSIDEYELNCGHPLDTKIIISEPRQFTQEWRFWIGDRKIKGFSLYAIDGKGFKNQWQWEPHEQLAPIAFMEKILDCKAIGLLPSQVVDIGLTKDGWAIVETNEAYASGIYGAAAWAVLNTLECTAQKLNYGGKT
jgi:hypothetical protein